MKKIYILFLLSLPLLLQAQTITQTDLPTVGTSFTTAKDTTYSGPIPSQGIGVTWNFSNLRNLKLDTSACIATSGTPYSSAFPNSNVASHHLADESYSYYTNDATGFYINGFGFQGATITYDPMLLFVPVPLMYGSGYNNTSRNQIDTTIVDSTGTTDIRIVIVYVSEYNAKGTGTLTIPSGTYQNVLRLGVTETRYDSLYIGIGGGVYVPFSGTSTLSYHYRMLTSGLQANFIMGIDADDAGNATSSEYLVDVNIAVPKISERKNVLAYPNPAINNLNFKDIGTYTNIVVFDNNGKEVLRSNQMRNNQLNVEMLQNGIYHYEIGSNDKVLKGNFVIQH